LAGPTGDGGEVGFVGEATLGIAQEIGTGTEQLLPCQQGVGGESRKRQSVQPLQQGAQNGLAVGGGPHTKQPEMINRQFQRGLSVGW